MIKSLSLIFLLFFATTPALAQDAETPEGQLIEAEDAEGADKYAQIVEDADASNGQAVTSGEAYRPLFRHAVHDDLPERVELWVRHRGGPLQLKFKIDGKQKEIKWDWSKPEHYVWTSFGTYDRQDMGEGIEFIRGNGDAPKLDAVVFAPVEASTQNATDTPQNAGEAGIGDAATTGDGRIPPFQPDENLPKLEATLNIDWSAEAGQLTPHHWGMSLYHNVSGKAADDEPYASFLTEVRPGLIRIHRAGLSQFWMNPQKTTFDDGEAIWDVQAIGRALAPVQKLRDAGVGLELMVCLSDWPTWLSETKIVPTDRLDQAAAAVTDLIHAVEATGIRVDAWELLNEADNAYQKAGDLPAMMQLFNHIAAAAGRGPGCENRRTRLDLGQSRMGRALSRNLRPTHRLYQLA